MAVRRLKGIIMATNKWGESMVVAAVICGTIGVIAAGLWYDRHFRHGLNVIDLEARAVSTWSKKEIIVNRGERVRIRIRNVDNVSHGFAIPELDIAERIIRAGRSEIVEFVPKYEGTFVYKCVVQCSRDKHDFMTGKLVVRAPGPASLETQPMAPHQEMAAQHEMSTPQDSGHRESASDHHM